MADEKGKARFTFNRRGSLFTHVETTTADNTTSKDQLVSRLYNVMTVSCNSSYSPLFLLLEAPTRRVGAPHVTSLIE